MLIGDYDSACKRHARPCECPHCRETNKRERSKRSREEWYRNLLMAYMQELSEHPAQFAHKFEEAEAFLAEIEGTFSSAKAA